MTVVSAFLAPGTPLPLLRPDNPPWAPLVAGYQAAGEAVRASNPDVLLVYSTQWIAVLDELWQTRAHLTGIHVDENWYEYGDLPFDMRSDVDLAEACVAGCKEIGVSAKAVDYDGFPIDTGTIVMNNFLNADGARPLVIAANNVYHDGETTARLAAMAVETAKAQNKTVALVAVGGLSGTIFRTEIDIAEDHIADPTDDEWNREMLRLMESGSIEHLKQRAGDYAKAAKVDMGFKHLSWILGGLGDAFDGATVHAYGPVYGSGAAVVEFRPT